MTVKSKLISSSILLVVLFIFVSGILVLGYRDISERAEVAKLFDQEEMYLQMFLRGLNEVILNEGTPQSLELSKNALDGFDEAHTALLLLVKDAEIRKVLSDKIAPKWKDVRKRTKPFFENHYLDFKENDALLIQYGSTITTIENIIKEVGILAGIIEGQLEYKSRKIQYAIVFSLSFALILISIHFIKISKSITGPIKELINVTGRIADGDLSQKVHIKSNDEFGELSASFNKMIADLEKAIDLRNQEIIERKKAEEKTLKQLSHIKSLRTIDQAISSSLDISITLNVLLEQVTTQLRIDAAGVLLLNPHTHFLEYTAGKGFWTDIIKSSSVRLGSGYAGRAAIERKSFVIKHFENAQEETRPNSLIKAEKFKTYIGIPLIVKGEVMGVLEVFQRSVIDFEPEWMEFLNMLAGQAAIAIDSDLMSENLHRTYDELIIAYDTTIEGWSRALDYRDKETEGHSQRVTKLALKIAQEMGIKDQELAHIRRGALLHDIGKLGVPDKILLKPGKLTEEEFDHMKRHTDIAFEILSPISFLRPALDIPYYHHEKWDGTGYPTGLKGDQIPISARIFAIVDVWDALCSDRPYRLAWPIDKVCKHIQSLSGTHFDPEVVKVFFKVANKDEGKAKESIQNSHEAMPESY